MRITNDMLAQYKELTDKIDDLKAQLKVLEKEREPLAIILKVNGSCSTTDYVAVIKSRERQYLPGIDVMIEKLGADKIKPLIKTTEWKEIEVSKKQKAA